jgi:aminoglycoside 6'-N-acetyltransferase
MTAAACELAVAPAYDFRRMTVADLPLLRGWLETEAWRLWWGEPETELENLAADLHEPAMRLWIVSQDGLPFAFMQDYAIHAWDDHPYRDLPPGTFGVDQSIGVPAMIGRGHGSAFIRQHVARLFAEGAAFVATDPDPDNARAIRAYEKAGFRILEKEVRITDWGRGQLMLAAN